MSSKQGDPAEVGFYVKAWRCETGQHVPAAINTDVRVGYRVVQGSAK